MRPLFFSLNITLDGCYDHTAMSGTEDTHRHTTASLARADALLIGRVTYEMMESAWRAPAQTGVRPEWMTDWMNPFARTIDAAKKYVVSNTLERVDWNAELVRGDLGKSVEQLKSQPGKGLFVAGVKLAQALTELRLIDEYEFMIHPKVAGRGPSLFAGLTKPVDLKFLRQLSLPSGAVVVRYELQK